MRRSSALLFALLVTSAAATGQPLDKRSAAVSKEMHLLRKRAPKPKTTIQCVVAGQIAYGQTVTGSLDTTDCFLSDDDESYVDYWQFQGTTGDLVVIDYASSDYDTYLALQDATGAIAAQNDDFGNGTNSHIAFTLTSTGTWVITATSLLPQVTGNYTIALQGTSAPPVTGCSTATALCLTTGRFNVSVTWLTTDGRSGSGNAVALTDDTGYFWFFDSANVELVVKVLDARPVNGHFWVFYGALSNVQYTISVTDSTNGATRNYANPQNTLSSFADTSAF
jgi:Bacterial pre-peptidase C-terminal domain